VSYLSYVSNGVAYVVDMRKEQTPVAVQNSSATHLSDAEYEDILYFGTKQYLVAFDEDRNSTVLITPDMKPTDEPIDIGDRKFLTITYPVYGEPVDGYLLYNMRLKMGSKSWLNFRMLVSLYWIIYWEGLGKVRRFLKGGLSF